MRDILKEEAEKIKNRLLELSSKIKDVGAPRDRRVGEKIRAIERKLETTPFLDKDQERETLKQLEALSGALEKLEIFRELKSEIKEMQNKLRQMQMEIKTYHTSVTTLANQSQVHQKRMVEATKEAKMAKEEADSLHAEVLTISAKIKEIKKELDAITKDMKILQKTVGIELKARRKERKIRAKQIRDEILDSRAEAILTKYKNGESLSLEEFRVLMERGLI